MRRRGFSLIELLVVVVILGIAIALLLPAIAGGHAAAQRTRCQNNLRQISLGLSNYHHEFEHFPSGYTETPRRSRQEQRAVWGWLVPMLPQMENNMLSKSLATYIGVDAVDNQTAVATTINISTCTSEPDYTAPLQFPNPDKTKPSIKLAGSNYVGCFGTEDPLDPALKGRGNGIFYQNSATTLDQILDGSSATFLVGERRRTDGPVAWAGGIGPNAPAFVLGSTGNDLGPNAKPKHLWQFSSHHGGGSYFAFGDGSVRFVHDTIGTSIYRAHATKAGGEIISDFAE